MAKANKKSNDNDENSDELEDLTVVDEVDGNLEEDEDALEVSIDDIPLEEFMKDPEKAAKYTDDAEVEETTAYCPQCSDYTIFVNGICTNCGFVKKSKNSSKEDKEEEESKDNNFDFVADDDLGIDYNYDENEESFD